MRQLAAGCAAQLYALGTAAAVGPAPGRTTPRRATHSATVRMTREILTIDLSDFENRKQEIASQLLHASKDVGFFYVSGHGCGGNAAARQLHINRMRARQLLRRWRGRFCGAGAPHGGAGGADFYPQHIGQRDR